MKWTQQVSSPGENEQVFFPLLPDVLDCNPHARLAEGIGGRGSFYFGCACGHCHAHVPQEEGVKNGGQVGSSVPNTQVRTAAKKCVLFAKRSL